MKRYTAPMSNTLPDKHGDRLTKEALEQLAASVRMSLIPINIEHDPRGGPCGRVISAEVRERTDGEYEVVAEMEVFEGQIEELSDGREIVQNRVDKSESVSIIWDRSYLSDVDQSTIQELTHILKGSSSQEHKKSVEPLSIFWVVGGFMGLVGSSLAAGFFGKMGADAWDALRSKLSTLMKRKAESHDEYLLIFAFQVRQSEGEHIVEVEVCIESPQGQDIDNFLGEGINILDTVVPAYIEAETKLRKLFFVYGSGGLELQYGVRRDCASIKFNRSTRQVLERQLLRGAQDYAADTRTSRG